MIPPRQVPLTPMMSVLMCSAPIVIAKMRTTMAATINKLFVLAMDPQ